MGELPFIAEPSEDAGATTGGYYHFQHCCAAGVLLAAIATKQDCEVICEWHEDFLVLIDGGVEAVSVKHRDQSKTKWSIATLVSDGKLGHLYETYYRGNGDLQCSFRTNRAHSVSDLWSAESSKREQIRVELADRLNISLEEVAPFVDRLELQSDLPADKHIASVYANDLAAAALDRLGLRLDPSQAMSVAADKVAAASRNRISSQALQAILAAPAASRGAVIAEQKMSDRRISSNDLAEDLQAAAAETVPRLEAISDAEVPPETTLTKKLRKGGLGPSIVESAGRRRARWYSHRARHRDIPYREEELDSLEEWVQEQANLAEITARDGGNDPYGGAMFKRLSETLSSPEAVPPTTRPEDRNPALLSGAAFELTDSCSIWWSPVFSVSDDDS